MEGEENEVKLHGMWASTYSKRVELALKIKGIPYEYIEEDLGNKSQALLEYNPVHKKVPVLVHNGKSIAESLVILEYVDEAWPDKTPRLLPEDPYERARFRFWASYFQNQLLEGVLKLFQCSEETEAIKAMNQLHGKMTLVEQEMKNLIPSNVSSINNNSLNLLDIQLISLIGAYKAQEEVIGKKILDHEKHPLIFAWVTALMNLPGFKRILLPMTSLLLFFECFSWRIHLLEYAYKAC